ncbi:hypothetical protein S245_041377, partial [Arachis hypogaea]
DWRSKPSQVTDSHQGRLLRYGALTGLMSLVAKLGSEDAEEFVVARDGIANLAEELQRRAYDRVGSQLGLSSLSALNDPLVAKTKGAPRKGKEPEPEPGTQSEVPTKRRRCTSCGVPGHTKRTCSWRREHRGAGTEGGKVPGCVECSSDVRSFPSATAKVWEAINSDTGDNGRTAPTRAEGAEMTSNHGCSRTACNPLMGVGGGGTNIFLGGQHIEQFFASQGCSVKKGESHGTAASPSMSNPTRHTNDELFEHWLSQNAAGRPSSSRRHGWT